MCAGTVCQLGISFGGAFDVCAVCAIAQRSGGVHNTFAPRLSFRLEFAMRAGGIFHSVCRYL